MKDDQIKRLEDQKRDASSNHIKRQIQNRIDALKNDKHIKKN